MANYKQVVSSQTSGGIHCYSITIDVSESSLFSNNFSYLYIQFYSPINVNAPTTKEEIYSLIYNTFGENPDNEYIVFISVKFKDTTNKGNYIKKSYITNFSEDDFSFGNPLGDLMIETPISSMLANSSVTFSCYKLF